MELVTLELDSLSRVKENLVVTIGQFDGLHIAHVSLISKTIEIAKSKGLKSGLITFDPHPDFVLKKDLSNTYVTPFQEKLKLINELGLDYLIVIKFNLEIASMEPSDFVNNILLANNVKEVVVGFDFRFGKKGSGLARDITSLSKNLIKTHIIEEIKYHNEKIGTTLVRNLLKLGKTNEVYQLLGRFYKFTGEVVRGNQVGRTIDLPTANFKVDKDFAKILPGVYAVRVTVDEKQYLGIANLGFNPSFNQSESMSFETHIFDFSDDIYGKHIDVELVEYLRGEVKFDTKEAFLDQISKDKESAKNISEKFKLKFN